MVNVMNDKNKQFLKDIKTVTDILVWGAQTESHFKISKIDAIREGKSKYTVVYSFSTDVFSDKRNVIVIF